jgi:hypothetical protein
MSSEKISRRRFLQTSSTAAALWIPAGVNGYTQQEMLSFASEEGMQRDISKWDLDTPSLCLDLDALEVNIGHMQTIGTQRHREPAACQDSQMPDPCEDAAAKRISRYLHGKSQ